MTRCLPVVSRYFCAAGPPRLANIGGSCCGSTTKTTEQNFARPMGFIQNFSLSQNMNLMRFFSKVPIEVFHPIESNSYCITFTCLLQRPFAVTRNMHIIKIYCLPLLFRLYFLTTQKLVNPHNVIIPPG